MDSAGVVSEVGIAGLLSGIPGKVFHYAGLSWAPGQRSKTKLKTNSDGTRMQKITKHHFRIKLCLAAGWSHSCFWQRSAPCRPLINSWFIIELCPVKCLSLHFCLVWAISQVLIPIQWIATQHQYIYTHVQWGKRGITEKRNSCCPCLQKTTEWSLGHLADKLPNFAFSRQRAGFCVSV